MPAFTVAALAALGTTSACSLLVDTSGLSGPGDGAADGASGADVRSDAAPDACVGTACAPPLSPCDGPCAPALVAKEGEPVRATAADESGVYWSLEGSGDIRAASVDGQNVRTVFDGDKAPRIVVLDATRVYWTEPNSGSVRAVLKNAMKGALAAELTGQPGVLALALAGDEVFFHVSTGEVKRTSTSLVGATVLTTVPTGNVIGIAADANTVYVGVSGSSINRVRTVPRSMPSALVDLSSKCSDLVAFTIDASRVYFVDRDTGRVASDKLDGSGELIHTPADAAPTGVAVDESFVYWTTEASGEIRRAPKAGGLAETLAVGQTAATAISVNSRAIYWSSGGTIMMLRKP